MTKVMSAGLEVNGDFLFFQVNAKRDNGDGMTWGFRLLDLKNYDDKDMDLKIFIEDLKGLISRVGRDETLTN